MQCRKHTKIRTVIGQPNLHKSGFANEAMICLCRKKKQEKKPKLLDFKKNYY